MRLPYSRRELYAITTTNDSSNNRRGNVLGTTAANKRRSLSGRECSQPDHHKRESAHLQGYLYPQLLELVLATPLMRFLESSSTRASTRRFAHG